MRIATSTGSYGLDKAVGIEKSRYRDIEISRYRSRSGSRILCRSLGSRAKSGYRGVEWGVRVVLKSREYETCGIRRRTGRTSPRDLQYQPSLVDRKLPDRDVIEDWCVSPTATTTTALHPSLLFSGWLPLRTRLLASLLPSFTLTTIRHI